MSSNTTLSPCPFCGGSADSEITVTEVTIACTECPARMIEHIHYMESADVSLDRLTDKWNLRTPDCA